MVQNENIRCVKLLKVVDERGQHTKYIPCRKYLKEKEEKKEMMTNDNSITAARQEEEEQEDEETMKIQFPRTQGQMICEYDIRQTTTTATTANTNNNEDEDDGGFNLTNVFNEFYDMKLPGISNTELRSTIRISGMQDIPQHKWYYPYCNLESHQILATFTVDGYGIFDVPTNYSKMEVDLILTDAEKPLKLQEYFQSHVCENMTSWRSHIQEKWDPNSNLNEGNSVHLEHSTYFLCGGADELNNYDDEEPDGGFLVLGMLVGIVMVLMIIGELQQFDNRSSSSRSSRRATRRRNGGGGGEEAEDSTTYEFEMV